MELWNVTLETTLSTTEYRELTLGQMRDLVTAIQQGRAGTVLEFRVWRCRLHFERKGRI